MRIRGVKYKCDRCGYEKFYEIDERGDFVRDLTKGDFHILSLEDNTHLCGPCSVMFEQVVKQFMEEGADD